MNIIVAMCKNRGMGFKNTIPWHLSSDLQRFKYLTTSFENKNNVIMGRKTWDSLPNKYKPLPKRKNIIISSKKDIIKQENVIVYNDINLIKNHYTEINKNTWIIGGTQIYNYALENDLVNSILVTVIDNEFECDVFFPKIPSKFQLKYESPYKLENNIIYKYQQWVK
jgi:dihydrofolate reductase|uniref:dihydrofolate reductase n=1 Tax=viral metagenome TaxID=1070528 RepID=A0A6C0AL02_9ZZZZ